ncbi:MAG: PD40 domain-containing protein, partial [Acidobacteriaceae bacterium]|nr:PD40 domain-containing protein [Acidobacteriaceae bacterium]
MASWSHDGKWIYFASTRTGTVQVWKIPANGGRATQITRNGGWVPLESPDRRYLFYSKPSAPGLWRLSLNGGEEEKLPIPDISGEWRSAFAVTKKGIYFIQPGHSGIEQKLRFLNFATGRITQLASIAKRVGVGLAVSPDERLLLYSQRDREGSDLMLVENFSDRD